jgi:hypothetical protein
MTEAVEAKVLSKGNIEMTHAEWIAEAERRFGMDAKTWRFVCPSCKHVASVQDWKDAGAGEGEVAFSCTYAGGGLFRLNPVQVKMPDGNVRQTFAFAEPTVPACGAAFWIAT